MSRHGWTLVLVAALLAGIGPAPATAAGQVIRPVQDRERRPDGPRGVPRVTPRPAPERNVPWRPADRRGSYQEPAFSRGYADGVARGTADRRDRDRYDPVGHSDYRRGDQGYYREDGSRDAYRNNYRAGFREGYDEGYRTGTRDDPRP